MAASAVMEAGSGSSLLASDPATSSSPTPSSPDVPATVAAPAQPAAPTAPPPTTPQQVQPQPPQPPPAAAAPSATLAVAATTAAPTHALATTTAPPLRVPAPMHSPAPVMAPVMHPMPMRDHRMYPHLSAPTAPVVAQSSSSLPGAGTGANGRAYRLEAQLTHLRTGLRSLQRTLYDAQAQLLARQVHAVDTDIARQTEARAAAAAAAAAAPSALPAPAASSSTAATAMAVDEVAPSAGANGSSIAPRPNGIAGSAAVPGAAAAARLLPWDDWPTRRLSDWTMSQVVDQLFLQGTAPPERLAQVTATAALVRTRRCLDPDATESSSGESDDEGDALPPTPGATTASASVATTTAASAAAAPAPAPGPSPSPSPAQRLGRPPLASAIASPARSSFASPARKPTPAPENAGAAPPAAPPEGKHMTVAMIRQLHAQDRRGVAWRLQWLRLQLLELDTRLAASLPVLTGAGGSFTAAGNVAADSMAPSYAPTLVTSSLHHHPTPTVVPGGYGAPSAVPGGPTALGAVGATAANVAAAANDLGAARTRPVPPVSESKASGRRFKLVTRRAQALTKPTGPTPFYHPFLSFDFESRFARRPTVTLKPLVIPKPTPALATATPGKSSGGRGMSRSGSGGGSSTPSAGPTPLASPAPRRSRPSLSGDMDQPSPAPSRGGSRPGTPVLSSGIGLKRTASSSLSQPPTPVGSAPTTPKKRRASSTSQFDIDRVVIPLNLVQPNMRITPIEVKEIFTPTWREITPPAPSLPEPTAQTGRSMRANAQKASRAWSGMVSHRPRPIPKELDIDTGESTDDEAYSARHALREDMEKDGKRFDVLAEERKRALLKSQEESQARMRQWEIQQELEAEQLEMAGDVPSRPLSASPALGESPASEVST